MKLRTLTASLIVGTVTIIGLEGIVSTAHADQVTAEQSWKRAAENTAKAKAEYQRWKSETRSLGRISDYLQGEKEATQAGRLLLKDLPSREEVKRIEEFSFYYGQIIPDGVSIRFKCKHE